MASMVAVYDRDHTSAGLFWLNIAQKPYLKDAQNTIGLLFFELLFLAFRTMFTALFTFPNEYKMVRRSSRQFPYDFWAISRSQ